VNGIKFEAYASSIIDKHSKSTNDQLIQVILKISKDGKSLFNETIYQYEDPNEIKQTIQYRLNEYLQVKAKPTNDLLGIRSWHMANMSGYGSSTDVVFVLEKSDAKATNIELKIKEFGLATGPVYLKLSS
jgi:hypothetical protein